MGVYGGPKILTDELVFALDAGSIRAYPGSGSIVTDLISKSEGDTEGLFGHSVSGPAHFSFPNLTSSINYGDINDIGLNDRTVNAWIRTDTSGDNVNSRWFWSKSAAIAGDGRHGFGLSADANTLRCQFSFSGASVLPEGTTVIPINIWFMATAIFDRSASIKIYLNGIEETLVGDADISGSIADDFDTAYNVRVGSYSTNTGLDPQNGMYGDVSNIYVYDKALTPEEILQIYNNTKLRFN